MSAGQRDLGRERVFLEDAAHGHRPFVDQAEARLAAGDENFGNSWAWIGIKKHLTELMEEAADVGSWSALAEQALDLDPMLSEQRREQIRSVLKTAARRGAQAHEALTTARDSLIGSS